jgi:hypothetical protein
VTWVLALETVQVQERLLLVPTRQLQLGEVQQGISCPTGDWILDDDTAVSALSLCGISRERRAPVQSLAVLRRP